MKNYYITFICTFLIVILFALYIIYDEKSSMTLYIKPIDERNIMEVDNSFINVAKHGVKCVEEFVPVGESGDFDEKIREMGNVLYDFEATGEEYKLVYSGYKGDYEGDNVYIGYAYSSDGKVWIKEGKLLDRVSEDPYVVKEENTYYIFVEDKEEIPFRSIRRFSSKDFITWKDDGVILEAEASNSWEDQDVSSPVVWIENDIWYMLYEGRGKKNQNGAVGIATSKDGLVWTKSPKNPILIANNKSFFKDRESQLKWATHLVPDDIVKLEDNYYISLHAYNPKDGWLPGLMESKDLIEFNDILDGPILNFSDIKIKSPMFFKGYSKMNIITDTENGIYCSCQS